ncbi:thermatolerance membrane protein [Sporothrix brasiliensis 5110]|uniref:Defect at low temperature protein 1 n=1 Tax=Sporothrix brasiliensis 5110 TaxID=1398154 RepID=A0A0C2IQN7_9PEZI|nr:thermotolerance membrane protein [Sporothrix brasiliensis 5110]KIH89195.1 thermatolerance membrane protein [Sporothrix brasiliensis 5110]
MANSAEIFFRVLYATVYTLLHVLLLALLLVTPGDLINQSRYRHDVVSILIVAGAYIFGILVIAIVFFLRLFLKRAVLNSIPKSWVPIEKGDVSKPVRSMISAGLSRSAAVAFMSRPRVVPEELLDEMCPKLAADVFMHGGSGGAPKHHEGDVIGANEEDGGGSELAADGEKADRPPKAVRFKRAETMEMEKALGIDLPPCQAVWGVIEHPGWAPPDQVLHRSRGGGATSGGREDGGGGAGGGGSGGGGATADPLDENINLQYSTVLAELPNLIEAKALTLAPPDPFSAADPPLFDPDAVALLERPSYMGLREYLYHLAELGVVDIEADAPSRDAPVADSDPRSLREIVSSFATEYEYARFSTRMISNHMFRQLMHDLATILRRMTPLDPSVLEDDEDDEYDESGYDKESSFSFGEEDDEDGDIIDNTTPIRSRRQCRNQQTTPSKPPDEQSGPCKPNFATESEACSTTAATITTARCPPSQEGIKANHTPALSRHPYALSSQPSSASLRSTNSSGSVIRLADRNEQSSSGLPYVIMAPTASPHTWT